MLASILRLAAAAPKRLVLGQSYAGGFYGGQILISGTVYNLVVASKTGGEGTYAYRTTTAAESGLPADNTYYGLTSTNLYADAAHPAFQWAAALTLNGFTDWYVPAWYELEIIYRNLKPSTTANTTSFGANPYANPTATSNYTTTVPGQTAALAFRTGGAEAFSASSYMTATQSPGLTTDSYRITFNTGSVVTQLKTTTALVRAIRRVAA